MEPTAQRVLDDLYAAAERHDAAQTDRLARWRVLEPDAGRWLWFTAQAVDARDIVEIGTSRGVSTLWLADAARRTGGRVLSLDIDQDAQRDAADALTRAGLDAPVTLHVQDGGEALAQRPDASVDLLFLDAERPQYPGWWPHPLRVLRRGGLLIADNATSHPEEIAPLRALLAGSAELTTALIPLGKGELVALRR